MSGSELIRPLAGLWARRSLDTFEPSDRTRTDIRSQMNFELRSRGTGPLQHVLNEHPERNVRDHAFGVEDGVGPFSLVVQEQAATMQQQFPGLVIACRGCQSACRRKAMTNMTNVLRSGPMPESDRDKVRFKVPVGRSAAFIRVDDENSAIAWKNSSSRS